MAAYITLWMLKASHASPQRKQNRENRKGASSDPCREERAGQKIGSLYRPQEQESKLASHVAGISSQRPVAH